MSIDYTNFIKIGDKLYNPDYGYIEVLDIEDKDIRIQTRNKKTGMLDLLWITSKDLFIDIKHYEDTINRWKDFSDSLKDKDLVWCWNNWAHGRELRFYDAKNKCTFSFYDGMRNGYRFTHMEKYVGEYPEWARKAIETLED